MFRWRFHLFTCALLLFITASALLAQDQTPGDVIGEMLSGWVIAGVGLVSSIIVQGLKKIKTLAESNDWIKMIAAGAVTGVTTWIVGLLGSLGIPGLDQVPSMIWDLDVGTATWVLAWLAAMGLHAGGKAIGLPVGTPPLSR